jgi:sigma-B regulation protein RsbU (phosphoserine phosphatase)
VNGKALQILMVEDSPDDAVLVLAELQRSGFAPRHQRVERKEEFLAALKNQSWDAVISDYVLPQFSGPEALKLFRQQKIDIPFIVVSGVCGEEQAVTMMKEGADDYILKGNLSRLAPALEREMEAAQDRRLHQRSIGAMQYLAAIVESSEDAIYGKSIDSFIVSWNPAAERLFGYSAEEIMGQSVIRLFPPNRQDEMLDILAGVRRGETVGIRETERLHKNGQIIPVAVTISPIKDASGEIIGASSIARDISKQKQAEAERQQLIDRLAAAVKRFRTADTASHDEPLPLPGIATGEFGPFSGGNFPKLTHTQYAGICSEGWQVFDTLHEAQQYGRDRLAKQNVGEYKVYDSGQKLVETLTNDPSRDDLKTAGLTNDPKPWWKFWKS